MADVITRFRVDDKQFNAKVMSAKKSLGGFSASAKSANTAMGGLTSALSASMMKFAGWTAALAAAAKTVRYMVQTNSEFEQSNANLAAILGKSRDEISALTIDAKKLGATTMFTAKQVTELQTELAKLGFSQNEIKNSTKAVLDLAAATGAGLGDAAALAGAALRAYGLDATEMERVASVLAVSTTKSALSFEKLATALPIVAPVAKQFGFTIEDTVALLGKLSDAGFDASSAATATRNIFLNMSNASGKLAQALGRPVKSLDDMAAGLVELRNKGVSLAEMLELTDKRSVAAFATFVDGADKLTELRDSITDCRDELGKMVDEQMNTLHGSVLQMQSAWDGLMLSFSNSNGYIKSVIDNLTRLLTLWTRWRNRNAGGDTAIDTYRMSDVSENVKNIYNKRRASGMTNEQIVSQENSTLNINRSLSEDLRKRYDSLSDFFDKYSSLKSSAVSSLGGDYGNMIKEFGFHDDGLKIGDVRKLVEKRLAQYLDAIDISLGVIDLASPSIEDTVPTGGGSLGGTKGKKENTAKPVTDSYVKGLYNRYLEYSDGSEYTQLLEKKSMLEKSMDTKNNPGLTAEEYKEMAEQLKEVNKLLEEMQGKMPITPGSINDLNAQLKEATDELNNLEIGADGWADALERVKTLQDQISLATGKNITKAQKVGSTWQTAVSAVGQLGGALQSVNNKGVNIAGIIAQGIANVALGLGEALSTKNKETVGPWDWIAAAISGTATMISTIAAIKSATAGSYATGGIVPGNSYSGDRLVANVNSGELILNRAQQDSLASQLSQTGIGGISLVSRISGRDIILAVNNEIAATGGSRGQRIYSH